MAVRRQLLGVLLAAIALVLGVVAYRLFGARPLPPLPPAARAPAAALQWEPVPATEVQPAYRKALECEGRTARFDPDDAPAEVRREQTAAKALQAIARGLAGRPAAADRALALFVQMAYAPGEAHAQFIRQNPQCVRDDSCGRREDAAVLAAGRPYRDALARLAVESNDAQAYDLAYHACAGVDAPADRGACALLSARQWTRIEPDNAIVWLFAAAEAAGQGQPALVDDAMFHASRAPRVDLHLRAYSKLLDDDSLRNADADVREAVTIGVLGMVAAAPYAPLAPVFDYCGGTAIADSNRHQVCDDLAHALAEHADSIVDLGVAAKLGERLGWPREKLDELRNRRDAYYQIETDRIGAEPADCATLASRREWIAARLAYGELAAAQRQITAGGPSMAQLAQRRREAVRVKSQSDLAGASPPASSPSTTPVR